MTTRHKFEINGHKYVCLKHKGIAGFSISSSLIATVAPVLAGMMNVDPVSGEPIPPSASEFAAAFAKALDREDWPQLMKRILSNTSRNGHPLRSDDAINAAFSGNYDEAWKAVMEVVKINRFLPELGTFMGDFSAMMVPQSDTEPSPPSS